MEEMDEGKEREKDALKIFTGSNETATICEADIYEELIKKLFERKNQLGKVSTLARESGIPRPTISRWVQQTKRGGKIFLIPQNVRRITDYLDDLSLEDIEVNIDEFRKALIKTNNLAQKLFNGKKKNRDKARQRCANLIFETSNLLSGLCGETARKMILKENKKEGEKA